MTTLGFLALTVWCGALSISDIRVRRLPNPLTFIGAGAVLVFAALTGQFWIALRGAGLLTVPYLLVHLVRPVALGAGDVKSAVGLGAAAALGGGEAWMWAALAAPLFTAAAGIGLILGDRAGIRLFRTTAGCSASSAAHPRSSGQRFVTVPHGPSMCAATLLGLALW